MFDHIGLKVKDLDASVRFYTAALGPLGYEVTAQDESSAAFGAERRRRASSKRPNEKWG